MARSANLAIIRQSKLLQNPMDQSLAYTHLETQPVWIDTINKLDPLLTQFMRQPAVAVDTESDSLYSYFEKVCLIQLSTAGQDYLIDPLAVDVSGLAPLFASRTIQKVFHAAEYDFLSLKRDYGFTFHHLFDTMLAARVLGWSQYGLGTLLKQYFGVELDKRFQRYNWSQRPLSRDALQYARLDTHYLLKLRDTQLEELQRRHRLREAEEAFERLTHVEPTLKAFDAEDFWRVKNARSLEPQQQTILRELFIVRDAVARRIDRPPFKVMNDSVLVALAQAQPRDEDSLKGVKGVGANLVRHNHAEILAAIQRGQSLPPPSPPTNHHLRPDDRILNRYEELRQWRNNLAAKRGVEPDVIMNNQTLMNIARRNPRSMKTLTRIGVLGDWQRETYGEKLLQVLKETED